MSFGTIETATGSIGYAPSRKLQLLGIALDPVYVKKLEHTVETEIKANRKRKLEKREAVEKVHQASKYSDSDENFYFIAGYTSGGTDPPCSC